MTSKENIFAVHPTILIREEGTSHIRVQHRVSDKHVMLFRLILMNFEDILDRYYTSQPDSGAITVRGAANSATDRATNQFGSVPHTC